MTQSVLPLISVPSVLLTITSKACCLLPTLVTVAINPSGKAKRAKSCGRRKTARSLSWASETLQIVAEDRDKGGVGVGVGVGVSVGMGVKVAVEVGVSVGVAVGVSVGVGVKVAVGVGVAVMVGVKVGV